MSSRPTTANNNNKNTNAARQEQEYDIKKDQRVKGQTVTLSKDEVIYIENVLVQLREMIPNGQGENTDLLETIVTAENILSARLDEENTGMANSGGQGTG